jgi:hypothetical protein
MRLRLVPVVFFILPGVLVVSYRLPLVLRLGVVPSNFKVYPSALSLPPSLTDSLTTTIYPKILFFSFSPLQICQFLSPKMETELKEPNQITQQGILSRSDQDIPSHTYPIQQVQIESPDVREDVQDVD